MNSTLKSERYKSAREFVRLYYNAIAKKPDWLHRFYEEYGEITINKSKRIVGKLEIYRYLQSLQFKDYRAKIEGINIIMIDSITTVVEVRGKFSNHNNAFRDFVQSFVLVQLQPKTYFVRNTHFQDSKLDATRHCQSGNWSNVANEHTKMFAAEYCKACIDNVIKRNVEASEFKPADIKPKRLQVFQQLAAIDDQKQSSQSAGLKYSDIAKIGIKHQMATKRITTVQPHKSPDSAVHDNENYWLSNHARNMNVHIKKARTIFIGCIPPEATLSEIKQIFGRFGKLDEVELLPPYAKDSFGKNVNRKYGFVVFEDERNVENSLQHCPIYYPENCTDGHRLIVEAKRRPVFFNQTDQSAMECPAINKSEDEKREKNRQRERKKNKKRAKKMEAKLKAANISANGTTANESVVTTSASQSALKNSKDIPNETADRLIGYKFSFQ